MGWSASLTTNTKGYNMKKVRTMVMDSFFLRVDEYYGLFKARTQKVIFAPNDST